MSRPLKTGIAFLVFAAFVLAMGYGIFMAFGSLGGFSGPLLLTGFGLPLLGSIYGAAIQGCGLDQKGCVIGHAIGFIAGVGLTLAIYFALGCFMGFLAGSAEKVKDELNARSR